MDGDAAASQFLLKSELRRPGDFRRASKRDAPVSKQADGQVQSRAVHGQFQPTQGFILNFNQHGLTVTAQCRNGKGVNQTRGPEFRGGSPRAARRGGSQRDPIHQLEIAPIRLMATASGRASLPRRINLANPGARWQLARA